MDEATRIDLALNSDFDPSLFDCWDETATKPDNDNKEDDMEEDEDEDDDEEDDDEDGSCCDDDDNKMSLPPVVLQFQVLEMMDMFQQLPSFLVGEEDKDCSLSNMKQARTSSPIPCLQSTDGSSYAQTSSSISTSGVKHNVGASFSVGGSHSMLNNREGRVSTGLHSTQAPQIPLSVNTSTSRPQQQLHPLAIQSSANCPPHLQNQQGKQQHQQPNFFQQLSNQQHQYGHHQHQHGQYQQPQTNEQYAQQQSISSSQKLAQQTDPTFLPLNFIPEFAAGNNHFQNPVTYFLLPQQQQQQQQQQQSQQSTQHVAVAPSPLVQMQLPNSSMQQPAQQSKSLNLQQQQQQNQQVHHKGNSVFEESQALNSSSTLTSTQQLNSGQQESSQSQVPHRHGHLHQHHSSVAAQNPSDLPPFLLFDAPIELRANFIQSQRQHGLPTMQDTNSIHYGMVVNGFHPQQGLTQQSIDGTNAFSGDSVNPGNSVSAGQVRLIDGRHGNIGSKRVKNAREQKRTQKITDLIDELRVKMERGGWKVGLKSKFHTLSSCAEYVKHLVQLNADKEEALKRARADLQAKKRTIEEDDKAQQDPSDPESTTSSLTVSTSSEKTDGSDKDSSGDACKMTHKSSTKKKEKAASKAASAAHDANNDKRLTHEGQSKVNENISPERQKRTRLSTHESSLSSATSSGGDTSGKQDPAHDVPVVDAMVSSVSDLTDSNKGGSSEGNCSRSSQNSTSRGDKNAEEAGSAGGTGSVSSDAAVARGLDNHGHDASHADVIVLKTRKRQNSNQDSGLDSKYHAKIKRDELTSLEKSFQLDYEEVFLKSNVPQILATTSGRIVAWNDFFLKITGLKAEEVERLTFFSLVQSHRLSTLFEIVAAALRSGTMQSCNEWGGASPIANSSSQNCSDAEETKKVAHKDSADTESKADAEIVSKRIWNYSAISLPCIPFDSLGAPARAKQNHHEPKGDVQQHAESRPLYITVTLMTDDDPRKRCFHCVFTDYPGTNGALNSVTPELLSKLFTKQFMFAEPLESTHGKRKRPKDYA